MKTTLELISVTTAFVSGMLLYYGSLGVPPEEQSYKGQTPYELAIKRRQRLMVWIGIPCAVIAFGCQVWIIFAF